MGLIITTFLVVIIIILFFFLLYKLWSRTFKHDAIIFVQTGINSGDGHFVHDRFRVDRGKGKKYNSLIFRKRIFDKTLSPPYNFWNVYVKKSWNSKPFGEYTTRQLDKLFRRGAIFYQPQEGELKPMKIGDIATLNVFDQDNRAFMASQIENDKMMVTDTRTKLIHLAMQATPFIIGGIIILIMWITFNTQMTENIAAICGQASASAGGNDFLGAVQGAVGG